MMGLSIETKKRLNGTEKVMLNGIDISNCILDLDIFIRPGNIVTAKVTFPVERIIVGD